MGLLQGDHSPPRSQNRQLLSPPQSSDLPGSRLWTFVLPRALISPSSFNQNVKGHTLNESMGDNNPLVHSEDSEEDNSCKEGTPCPKRRKISKTGQALHTEIDYDNASFSDEIVEFETSRSKIVSAPPFKAILSPFLENGNGQIFRQEHPLHNRSDSVGNALSALTKTRLEPMANSASAAINTLNTNLVHAYQHSFIKFKLESSKTVQVSLKHFDQGAHESLVPFTVKETTVGKHLMVQDRIQIDKLSWVPPVAKPTYTQLSMKKETEARKLEREEDIQLKTRRSLRQQGEKPRHSSNSEDTEMRDAIIRTHNRPSKLSRLGISKIPSLSQSSDDKAIARLFEALERGSPYKSNVAEWERQFREEVDPIYDALNADIDSLPRRTVNIEVVKGRRAKILEELSRDYHRKMSTIYGGARQVWHKDKLEACELNLAAHAANERKQSQRARSASDFPKFSIGEAAGEDQIRFPIIILDRSGGNQVSFTRESTLSREFLSRDETICSASRSPTLTSISSHNAPSSPEWTPTTKKKKAANSSRSRSNTPRIKTKSTKPGDQLTAFNNDNCWRSSSSDKPADRKLTHPNSLLFSHYTRTSLPNSYNEPSKPKSGLRYLPETSARRIAFNAALDAFEAEHTVDSSDLKSPTPSSPATSATVDVGDGEGNTTCMGIDSDPEAEDESAVEWDEEQRGARYASAIHMGVFSDDESEDERPSAAERKWGFDALWPEPEQVGGEGADIDEVELSEDDLRVESPCPSCAHV